MENTEKEHILFITQTLQWELLSMKYIQEIFKELTDEVTKYLRVPTPTKIEQEEEWIKNSRETYQKWENINFIVTDDAGDFIGICGVLNLNTSTPEVGLRLKQSARGKWYGKEMIAGLINRLEKNKKFDYILYRAHVENVATHKIATSFGWELQRDEQGNAKIFIEHKFDNSSSFEAVEYRIYKK